MQGPLKRSWLSWAYGVQFAGFDEGNNGTVDKIPKEKHLALKRIEVFEEMRREIIVKLLTSIALAHIIGSRSFVGGIGFPPMVYGDGIILVPSHKPEPVRSRRSH